MRILNKYELLIKMLVDEHYLKEKLTKSSSESSSKTRKALVGQYEWTVICIKRACEEILEEDEGKILSEEDVEKNLEIESLLLDFEKIFNNLYSEKNNLDKLSEDAYEGGHY